jgi:hypothetical protein
MNSEDLGACCMLLLNFILKKLDINETRITNIVIATLYLDLLTS